MSRAVAAISTLDTERQAVKLEAATDSMEDYLETRVPPLAQELSERFIVVQDLGQADRPAELLTVNDQGQAIHFVPDKESQSGWKHYRIAVPGGRGPVTALRGFYQNGILYAFMHYAPAKSVIAADTHRERGAISRVVPMIRDRDGQWSRMELSRDLRNVLLKVRQLDIHLDGDGKPYIYGLSRHYSPEAFFIVTQNSRGQWGVVHLEDATGYDAYRLAAGMGDQELTVVRIEGPNIHYRAGSIQLSRGRRRLVWVGNWLWIDLRHGDLKLDQLITFPKRHRGLDFLVLSSQRHLDHVVIPARGTPTVKLLSGRSGTPENGIGSVALSVDSAGLYSIFVLGKADRRLWILRQQRGRKKVAIDYDPWSEIGDPYSAIAAPVSRARGAELFGVDMGRRVLHAHQPFLSETDVWQRTVLESPKRSTDPLQRCTTHNLDLTALDDNGLPVADAVIHVSADRVTSIYVNGLSYRVGPKPLEPVAFRSNSNGRISLRVPCRRQIGGAEGRSLGLTAPVITARVTPRGRGHFQRQYAPDLAFYKRMANLDRQHPMTAERLKAKGFLPNNFDPAQANLVAAASQQAAKSMVFRFAHQDPEVAVLAKAPFAERAWEFDFGGGGLRAREVTSRQFDRIFTEAPKGIGRAFGDLFRWIISGAGKIFKAILKVTRRAIELVIETARGIQTFLLNAAAQAAEFLNGLYEALARLAKKIKDAAAAMLEMFEALLSFDDIVITKDVLKAGFTSFMASLQKSLTHGIPEYLTGKFQQAERNLDASFEQTRAALGDRKLTEIARQNGGGHGVGDNPYGKVVPGHSVRSGFAGQFAINALEGSQTSWRAVKLSAREQKRLGTAMGELQKIYRDNGLEVQAKRLTEDLSEIFKKPENLLNGTLRLLLNLLHGALKLTLRVANALINLVLKFLGTALGVLMRLFEAKISIPVVSALYKQVTGSDLTLLDLSLLIVSVPGTILYKVISTIARPGKPVKRPFERSHVATIRTIFAKFGDLRRMIEGPARSRKMTLAQRKTTKALTLVLGLVSGCATFLYFHFEAATDSLAAAEVPVPELGAIACTIGVVMIFLGTPIAILNKSWDDRSTAEKYGLAMWVARFAPLGLNVIVASFTKGAKTLKGIPKVGPVITALIGVVFAAGAAVGIGFQIAAGSVAGVLAGVTGFCAGCSDIARVFIPLVKVKPPWGAIAIFILLGVGAVSGLARSGLTIAAAIAAFAA